MKKHLRLLSAAALFVAGCSNSDPASTSMGGGSALGNGGAGGNGAPGGGTKTVGGSATGGAIGSGGNVVVGGMGGAGGNQATGGAPTNGGTNATGGAVSTGGNKASGGSVNTGGVATTGGTSSAGGAKATGGTSNAGGAKATGGAPAAGGTATGGAKATGGATAAGGVAAGGKASGGSATGGAATGGAATGGKAATGGAPAATACSSALSSAFGTPGNPTYTTYSAPNPVMACGYNQSNNNIANIAHGTLFAAIPDSSTNFAKGDRCGACVQIGSAIITIVDECPTSGGQNAPCANNLNGHLDLSTAAASAAGVKGDPALTNQAKWSFVPCPVTGNVVVRLKNGNNNEIFIENVILPIKSVSCGGQTGSRTSYGAWTFGGNVNGQSCSATDIAGRSITFTVGSSQGQDVNTGVQFPACSG
jgi:hypothetical protein